MSRVLVPGRTCATVVASRNSGVLIDGRDYYREVYRACVAARHYILLAGWQFDSHVHLLRGTDARDARYPVQLLPLLESLCRERPDLHVYVLAWDASALFTFQREPLQSLVFKVGGHERIHYQLDGVHPVGASHHQKAVIVDRKVGFVGGMDVCASRWDDRAHAYTDERRVNPVVGGYRPYHDVQAYVTGAGVDTLTTWFNERWERATGSPIVLPELPRGRHPVKPTVEVRAPRIGLCRTQPRLESPAIEPVHELRELYLEAIGAARRSIYIENQYFSSEDVFQALKERLSKKARPPLELVMILPARTQALSEKLAMGIRQDNLLRELDEIARANGHHFGVYHSVAIGEHGEEQPVYVHAKLMAIDDRFLLISSANTTNRSMGLDTELGIAWESRWATPSIRKVRVELLRDATGVPAAEAHALLAPLPGLVARLDERAVAGRSRLRKRDVREGVELSGVVGRVLPHDIALDPDSPIVEEAIEAASDETRPLGDRVAAAWNRVRDGLHTEHKATEVPELAWQTAESDLGAGQDRSDAAA